MSVAASGACAPALSRPGPTTTTGADITSASAVSPRTPPAPRETGEAPAAPGQLVCRTKDLEGTTELFLEWNGDAAKGILHSVKPSGMVYDQRVTAERGANGLIIVDEPGSSDLVCHAAVIVPQNGKQHIRLGAGHGHDGALQPWTDCE